MPLLTFDEVLDWLNWEPCPAFEDTLDALDVCRNCLCSDCGCCQGCGQVDGDVFGVHGYPGCV